MENKTIRILNIVPNMRAAGIETFIMNVYRNIEREKVQFDFLVHDEKKEFFDDEIENLGGKIHRLTFKDDKNIFKYIKDLNNFFKNHKEYQIVHGHMQSMMPLYLLIAKINKVPIRIAHSHNGNYEKTLKGFILHVFSRFSKLFSTHNWACSKIAGEYLFGKSKFDIYYNGINVEKFKYDLNLRENVRKKFNIENKIVLLHVGRFELQKNHEFLINLFEKYCSINKNAILLLLGEGKLKNKIQDLVSAKGLKDNVIFMGIRDDVNEIMQAADFFLLPSLYEGLPVVGVEAQYSNIRCLFSNTITEEVKISNQAIFLKTNDEYDSWIKSISRYDRNLTKFQNLDKFEIKFITEKIKKEYERLYDAINKK